MRSSSNKVGKLSVNYIAEGFIHSMYFDPNFNFLKEEVEKVRIHQGAPRNWESKTIMLIPCVYYKYVHVCKIKPNSKSDQAVIDQVQKKIKAFASKSLKKAHQALLEKSYRRLENDPIAKKRGTREMPEKLKQLSKALAKNKIVKPGRRPKK